MVQPVLKVAEWGARWRMASRRLAEALLKGSGILELLVKFHLASK